MSPERILTKLGINNVISANVNDSVENVLKILHEKQVRAVPVVDNDGVFKGLFSTHEIIKSLVPTYMTGGLQTLDFAAGSSGLLSSRLKKLFPAKIGEMVSADECFCITDKTNTWEALRMLTKHGSPLPVLGPNGHLIGLISEQSAIEALLNTEEDEDELDHQE